MAIKNGFLRMFVCNSESGTLRDGFNWYNFEAFMSKKLIVRPSGQNDLLLQTVCELLKERTLVSGDPISCDDCVTFSDGENSCTMNCSRPNRPKQLWGWI